MAEDDADSNGKESRLVGFRLVRVFAVDQTDGNALPMGDSHGAPEREIYGETDAEDLREAVNSILPSNGSLSLSEEKSNARGPLGVQEFSSSDANSREDLNSVATLSTA